MDRYICIHGHFYQPPRENPWLEEVELQDSAYPYHDWNERISTQCYAPNGRSRILDPRQRIIQIVNNYSKMSFNFGPTLLAWLERHQPETYAAILEADQLSQERFSGHGSAIAQAYNHIIMPLANKRDKYTQVIWGVEDFRRRFQRDPEGMWLPETAVDLETLEVLAEFGIRFTILAPRQAKRVRKMDPGSRWHDVNGSRIDPSKTYLCHLPSGKSINLFFYDGPISQDIAFGGLLNNGEAFAQRLVAASDDFRNSAQLIHVATDGETFGHHHRHGDRALAYCLYYIESQNLARLTNYGEYLEKHPPVHQVEIFENSSWSCVHGIERWKENCGCHSGMHPGWTQNWRGPLRSALDWLRDEAVVVFEEQAGQIFRSPWEARNDYSHVVANRSEENVGRFLSQHAVRELTTEEEVHALSLLEMQRNAMLMYTSCGWFFDEVSGIETVQVMQYAAMVIQFVERLRGRPIENEFASRLEAAPSNIHGNAGTAYEMFVKPTQLDLLRVGVHYALSSLFENYADEAGIFCYRVQREDYHRIAAGKLKLAIGKARVTSGITWDSTMLSFAVLHLGDHNVNGGLRVFQGEEAFQEMHSQIRSAFDRGDTLDVIRLMDNHFGINNYSVWHLFRDEQRKVIDQILELTYRNIEASYRKIYEDSYHIINFLNGLNIPTPKHFSAAAEDIINIDIKRTLQTERIDISNLQNLIVSANRWRLILDKEMLSLTASFWLYRSLEHLQQQPLDIDYLEETEIVLDLLKLADIEPDLWKAQNMYFYMGVPLYSTMKEKAESGDEEAHRWITAFEKLGRQLQVKLS
jgi:alpha-amylase/alpha-mannosidase (GH57 family)